MAKNSMKPQIRFKGFTDAWEQRKVQDVADRYDNLRIPVAANLRVSGNIPYYGANGIQDYVNGFTHEGEFVLVAEDGANDLKNYPVQHVQGRIWVNNHAHVLQGKPALMNNLFLAYSLHRADIASFLVGGSRAKLNADTLMTLELLLPSVEEQTKIGRNLAAVDNLITLHQRKYEKFVNIKKALLEKMFPQGDEKVPRIRFKGFTDAWEQRKLGEISEKTVEKNRERRYSETFTNSAEFGIVSQMEYFDHAISKIESIGGYYVVHPDDFVYNPRISVSAPVGPINRNKLQKIGIMSPLYTVFRAHDIHPQYLEYYFKSDVWHAYMRFNGDSGARSDRFSIKTALFFDMPIPCPSVGEQEKIGKILARVDNLITLHQRGEKNI